MSIVALDIASKAATFCVLGPQGITGQGSLTFDHDGFSSFIASEQVFDASLFVMESTGGYHLPLYHFLLNHGRKARIINPLLVKRFHEGQTLRRTKTDALDAVAIARYAQANLSALEEDRMQLDSESKMLARRRAHNAEDLAKAKTILKSDLSVAFPELLRFNVFTKTLLEFLSVYGSAKDVLAATEEQLQQALDVQKGRKSEEITVQSIKDLAQTSIGVSYRAAMVRDSAKTVLACQQRDEELTKALVELEKALHHRQMEILTSIPGIGEVTASHFLSEIPDISRFATYQKLIAFAGTDPGIYESGNTSKQLRISKHGNPILRKYLYLIADSCMRHNVVFNAYYHKKREEGFPHRKAMVATMNKLVRTLHALLTKDETYSL
ncbi:MAG: IS110 family transposase [Sphaerochaetaceae bacterium]|jgi:transposase|nr:IS110 family transposase [Sphaerochaetaceae bacterium]MDX9810573.1 IS110 family transposase [Sphaerochaetaceae bacterium]